MIRIPALLALAAAALAAPAALRAQDPAPRDTIVIVPRDTEAARADTLVIAADEAPAPRPSRRGQPFAVRSSGRVAPHAPPRDVVWIHPDSIRRPSADTIPPDSVPADSMVMATEDEEAPEGEDEVLLDTAAVDEERPARRRTSNTDEEDAPPSTRRRRSTADEDAPPATRRRNVDPEDEDAAPSTRRRSAATDEEADADAEPAPRRTTRSGARADSTSTRRSTTTTRTAARDSAARRTTPAATRTTGGRARSHTVADGETFFGIARRYGVTTAQLRALNPDVEWERLRVGTELRLPAAARTPAQSGQRPAASTERATTTRPAPAQRGRRTHTVASGETLFGLARRYGVSAAAIREANDLEGDRLRIGQTLVIPRAPQR